jgi:hypothetical protein
LFHPLPAPSDEDVARLARAVCRKVTRYLGQLTGEDTDEQLTLDHLANASVQVRIKKLYPNTPVMMVTAVKAATGLSFAADSAVQQSWLKAALPSSTCRADCKPTR